MDVKSSPVEKIGNDLISRLPEEMDPILEFQRSIGDELYMIPRIESIAFQIQDSTRKIYRVPEMRMTEIPEFGEERIEEKRT